uniref:homeobox-leucine zipper protein HDG11-like n=1 Tax=Erigeron canadensis TaxID=72917 RepID=UPI001CB91503|nr:homeobox-leucine zipper protein HDG11-like [Erigeron canadensis]
MAMASLIPKEICSTQEYPKETEDGEIVLDPGDEYSKHEQIRHLQATRVSLECKLLKGAFSFAAVHPPHQRQIDSSSRSVLSSFLTKDGRYIDHSLVAACAVHELSALALDKDGSFWTNDGLLNQLHYQQTFPRPEAVWTDDGHANSSWTRASRASAVVKMEHTLLAKKLTIRCDRDWEQLFPSIVSKSTGLRFLVQGSPYCNPDGSVQLIQISLQATTPIVPARTFVILRACKKIDESTWVVADVSVDSLLNVGYPCGCLIQGIADGSSQVTWVEHLELEQSYLDPKLYNDLCCRGFAFGVERWVACLARSCERRSYRPSMPDIALTRLRGQGTFIFPILFINILSSCE